MSSDEFREEIRLSDGSILNLSNAEQGAELAHNGVVLTHNAVVLTHTSPTAPAA